MALAIAALTAQAQFADAHGHGADHLVTAWVEIEDAFGGANRHPAPHAGFTGGAVHGPFNKVRARQRANN
jgi:hypothetical protein